MGERREARIPVPSEKKAEVDGLVFRARAFFGIETSNGEAALELMKLGLAALLVSRNVPPEAFEGSHSGQERAAAPADAR